MLYAIEFIRQIPEGQFTHVLDRVTMQSDDLERVNWHVKNLIATTQIPTGTEAVRILLERQEVYRWTVGQD